MADELERQEPVPEGPEGWQTDEEPWDETILDAVNRVDALVAETIRAQDAAEATPDGPGRDPYHPARRPHVRAQFNPVHRLHPDWPEEWYVRVPGTRVTWRPSEVPRGQRLELHAFPSREAAEADAVTIWRDHWRAQGKTLSDRATPVIVSEPVYTVNVDEVIGPDAWALLGSLPDGGVLHMKGPRPAAAPSVSPAPAWVAAVQVELGGWAFVRPGHPPSLLTGTNGEPLTVWEPTEEDLTKRLPPGLVWAPTRDTEVPALAGVRVRRGTPELLTRMGTSIQAVCQTWDGLEVETVTLGPTVAELVTSVRRAGAPPVTGEDPLALHRERWMGEGFQDPVPVDVPAPLTEAGIPAEGARAVQSWMREGREVLRAVRAHGLGTRLDQAALAAVAAASPADGSLPLSPAPFRRALQALADRVAGEDRELALRVRLWCQHGEALTADSLGLFAGGRLPDDVAAVVAGAESAVAIGTADAGTLARLDRAELFATPLPSGRLVLWGADKTPGDTFRRETPAVYQVSLMETPEPQYVETRVCASEAEARAVAADRGMALTILAHPDVPESWANAVRIKHHKDPQYAERLIETAMTPRPAPEAPALTVAPPQTDTPRVKPGASVFVGPWRSGEGVLWMRDGRGRARLATPDGAGGWKPAEDADPVVVRATGGFAAVVQQARADHAGVEPQELPTPLARQVATQIGPPALAMPHDVHWRVTGLPDQPAATSWTYVYRMTPRANGEPSLALEAAPLARTTENRPALFGGASRDEAMARAVAALSQEGYAVTPLGTPTMPRIVADQVFQPDVDRPRAGVRPVEPFTAFAELDQATRRQVLAALPSDVRSMVVPAAYGLTATEIAAYRNMLPDVAAGQYRQAERTLGDWFMAHPDVRPAPDPTPVPEPESAPAPDRLADAPRLSVRPT